MVKSYFLENSSKIEFTIDNIILNKSAHQKLSTPKPLIKKSAIRMMTALMTKRKRPNENNVIGIVRSTNTGLTNTFRMLKMAATIIAVK